MARVDLHEGHLELPHGAEGLALEASEDCQADDARGHRICCDLIELQPSPVQHLQGEQRPCTHQQVSWRSGASLCMYLMV